jgi:pimeloyl-ACP methyl ester carboxylesterase
MPNLDGLCSRTAGVSQVVLVALALLICTNPASASDEFIELTIPLRQGRFYSLRDFYRESNRKLGTDYPANTIAERQLEITDGERAALLLASTAGIVQARIETDRLTILVPNHEDDRVRQQNRRRLERLLGIRLDQWPPEKGLHWPSKLDPAARTILLIHGFQSDASATRRFAEACERTGIQAIIFDYPANGPLAWAGDRLSTDLKALAARYPNLRIVMVGHSMGGLVARYCLEAPDKNPGCVTDLFLLGTPNTGTELAAAHEWLELIYTLVPGVGPSQALAEGLGEASDDLQPGSQFLKTLNGQRKPHNVRYHVAIGRKSFLTNDQRRDLERQLTAFFERRGTEDRTRAEVLGYLRSEALQNGRGDGVVPIASARLTQAADEKVFDLNHIELFSLPGSAAELGATFIWVNEVMQWKSRTSRR